jgi:hypothetical protein
VDRIALPDSEGVTMRWFTSGFLALWLLLGPRTASATTGSEVLTSCEVLLRTLRMNNDQRIIFDNAGFHCWFYLSAIQDASILAEEGGKRMLGFCPPATGTLTQLIRVFVQHVNARPAQLHEDAAHLAIQAYRDAYPCRRWFPVRLSSAAS